MSRLWQILGTLLIVSITTYFPFTATRVDAATFNDVSFASGWSVVEVLDTASNGTASATPQTTGGNPGAYLAGQHTWGDSSDGTNDTISYAFVSPFTYDPGTSGAITALTFSYDFNVLSVTGLPRAYQPGAVATMLALQQGGTWYRLSGAAPVAGSGWHTYSESNASQSEFFDELVNFSGGGNIPPDFSASGDPITFALMVRNESAVNVTAQYGFDNFHIAINETGVTPLPAALPLFASGLGALGLLGWRKKRKNSAALAAA